MLFWETSQCADVTASLWDMQAKTHVFSNDNLLCFLLITVSFLTYLIIFTPDKNTTDLLAITDISISCLWSKLKLKQDSWFYSHLGHCSLGGISRCLAWHLPQVFACYLPLTTISLHFYRHYTVTEYAFFTEKADKWGKDMASLWGNLNICPHLYWLRTPLSFPSGIVLYKQP